MTRVRAAAFAAIAGGLLAGSLGAVPPETVPRRGGGYEILDADFHVHGFAGDGTLAPWALRREVQRAGIEVFALTNHNQTFTARFAHWLTASTPGPIVIPGQEVTGVNFHISAVGIASTIDASQPASQVIEDIHAQGGIAIANHPESAQYTSGYDARALALLDGFERAHSILTGEPEVKASFEAFERAVIAVNPTAAFIGSSDYHGGGTPGWCRTYVLARERTTASVMEALRDGRTVAADADGQLYGPAEYVALVRSVGGDRKPQTNDLRATFAAGVVWVGLLALFLSPGGVRRR